MNLQVSIDSNDRDDPFPPQDIAIKVRQLCPITLFLYKTILDFPVSNV